MASLRAWCAPAAFVACVVTAAAVAVAAPAWHGRESATYWPAIAVGALLCCAAAIRVGIVAIRERNATIAQFEDAVRELSVVGNLSGHGRSVLPETRQPDATGRVLAAMRERLLEAQDVERAAADRYRAMIDTVTAGVFAVDGGGRIVAVNTAAAAMFGRTRDTMLGSLLSDLVATESLHLVLDELGGMQFPDRASDAEYRFSTSVRRFGLPTFPAEVTITPLAIERERVWALCIDDLTHVNAAAVALDEARAAEELSSRGRTRFLSNMSRQVRTSLTLMINHARTVRRSHSTLGERDALHLDRIQDAGEHLLVLVNDILDFTRTESGAMTLAMTELDIRPIVAKVMAEFEPRVAGRPVVLEAALPPSEAMATVDPVRLHQILSYLVGNAVKFTARGSVRIAVILDHVSGRTSAILVQDTGIGIPLDGQARIFTRFEQANANTGSRYGGAGLGLALSRRIAHQMGCTLSVESMPGAGSTFTVTFPGRTARSSGRVTISRADTLRAGARSPR
jgi:PAS domain S-box-containing protein